MSTSSLLPLRDKTAITGLGWTTFSRASGMTEVELATEACLKACADAGLETREIDGLVSVVQSKHALLPDSPLPHEMVDALGLSACNYQAFDGLGGAWCCAAVITAAMAVHSGLCRNVLVYRGCNGRSGAVPVTRAVPAKADGPDQWLAPFGFGHGATVYGPAVTAHMAQYGTTNEDFGHVAVVQREHARLNRKAQMQGALTLEDHQNSPWIIYPFRLYDCCVESDYGIALVVSGADTARHLDSSPVLVSGAQGGSLFTDKRVRGGRPLWETNCQDAARRLYAGAGLAPSDVDFAELYDPFSGVCLLHMEGFGLVPEGEAAAAVRAGETRLDGWIPVNTHGGLLSEAHTYGLGHVVEAVQQLRAVGVSDDYCDGAHDYDRTRCRQVREPEIGLVCSPYGESSLLLKRAA